MSSDPRTSYIPPASLLIILFISLIQISLHSCKQDPGIYGTTSNNTGGGNSGNGNNGNGSGTNGNIGGPYSGTCPLSTSCGNYFLCMSVPGASALYTCSGNLYQAYGASAATQNKVYFAGGSDDFSVYGGSLADGIEYNPDSNLFRNFNLSIPRSFLAGAVAGNKILFAGGQDVSHYLNYPVYSTVDIYDEQSLAHTVATLSEARSHLASGSSGTQAFFIGGKTQYGFSNKMDIYHSTTNSWEVITMPRERGYGGAAIIGNSIYIAGGKNSSGDIRTIDIYDIQSQSWTSIEAPNYHPFASVAAVNNKLIVAGGDGQADKYADILDTATGQWTTVNLSSSRFNMTVASVNNKIIFLGGASSFSGINFSNESGDIDVYDDNSGSWSVGSVSPNVNGMMAASLGGKVILVGFMSVNGTTINNTMVILTL